MPAKFSVEKSRGGNTASTQSANGETVATSEVYESKSNAKRGPETVQRGAAASSIVDDIGE